MIQIRVQFDPPPHERRRHATVDRWVVENDELLKVVEGVSGNDVRVAEEAARVVEQMTRDAPVARRMLARLKLRVDGGSIAYTA